MCRKCIAELSSVFCMNARSRCVQRLSLAQLPNICIFQYMIKETNAALMSVGTTRTKFDEISKEIETFSLNKMYLKILSAKCQPFCTGRKVIGIFFQLFTEAIHWLHWRRQPWQPQVQLVMTKLSWWSPYVSMWLSIKVILLWQSWSHEYSTKSKENKNGRNGWHIDHWCMYASVN